MFAVCYGEKNPSAHFRSGVQQGSVLSILLLLGFLLPLVQFIVKTMFHSLADDTPLYVEF